MEQRVSIITLGVADLDRSRKFYERLGWRPSISEYQLTRALPKELRSSLPTVEEMEKELTRLTAPVTPAKKK